MAPKVPSEADIMRMSISNLDKALDDWKVERAPGDLVLELRAKLCRKILNSTASPAQAKPAAGGR